MSVCNNVVAPNIHAALSNGSFPVSLTNGSCDWNGNIDEASCTNSGGRKVRNAYRADVKFCTLARGCFRTLRNRRVTRTYTFPLSILGGTGSRTTANGMKSRDVVNGSVVIVRVKDTVRYRGQTYQIATGSMRVRPGDYRIAGMYFDVEDNDDNVEDSHETFPPWFFANDWHHFMYVKVAKAETADGSGTCLPGGETEELRCITLQISDDEGNLTNDRNDAEAVVVIAGSQVDSQDRTTLAAITDYFENRNNQSGNDIVVRAEHRDDYNDRVRVVWPNPG